MKSRVNWPALIEQQERSGLSQREFCASQGISLPTFGYWKGKIKKTNAIELYQPKFIELEAHSALNPPPTHDDLVVELPFGVVMRFRGTTR